MATPSATLILRHRQPGGSAHFAGRALGALALLAVLAATLRADLAERRTIAAEIHDLSSDAATSGDKDKNDERLAQLQSLDALYVQIQTRRAERQRLEDQQKALERAAESHEKPQLDEPKPYSFLLYDSLQDQLAIEKDRAKALTAESKSIAKLLAAAHEALDQESGAENNAGKETAPPARPSDDLAIARQRAQVQLRALDVDLNKLRQAVCEAKQKELQAKIAIVHKDVRFSAADRDKQLATLSESEALLKGQRRQVERELQRIEGGNAALARPADASNELQTDNEQASNEQSNPPQHPRDAKAAGGRPVREAVDACQSQLVLLDERLEWLNRLRRVWRQRYDLANEKLNAARLQQWLDDETEFREDLNDAIRALENRRDTARTQRGSTNLVVERPENPPPAHEDAQSKAQRELRDARLGELAETCAATLLDAQATERILDRFHAELTDKLPEESTWGSAGQTISRLFHYPIAGEDDHTVTLGTLLVLLACVLAGVLFSWAFSRAMRDLVLKRFGLHRGKVDAVNSILFYALCFVFGFTAFRVLNVPLAAFAFLGGAAAIAVGFGSQDIMNNFMSGVILLAEQPIRVGDVARINGVTGVVMHIGMRSTRLRTESNYEVTVPNKALLDEQVTNFTLSDNMVQVSVVITLDRETKIAEAKKNMLKVVFGHPVIVKSLQPLVLVKEIDNYWLTFEIRFWLQYQNFQQCAVVQSQIMEVIGDMYRPLTDEEKEAKRAAAPSIDRAGAESATESEAGADVAAGETLAEQTPRDEAADGVEVVAVGNANPQPANADVAPRGLDPAAKMMFRKLGRKIVKR